MDRLTYRFVVVGVLLAFFGLAVGSMVQKSPTFDEQGFLVRGLAYVRGENRHMMVGHPLGLNGLNALLLWGDDDVVLPVDHPSWQETSFHRPAELFLWEIGNDVESVMFRARIMTVFLGMVLCVVVALWAMELTGSRWGSVVALVVIGLDPNVLAHTRLTTTDLGVTFGAAVAGYTLWRYVTRPSVGNMVLAGVGFGVLNNTKFTAGLFVPLFTVVILVGWVMHFRNRPSTRHFILHTSYFIFLFPLVSFLTLWGMYGFEVGTLSADVPVVGGMTIPLAHHMGQLLDIGDRSGRGAAAFLLGEYSREGWWYYFPVAFGLKVPLATMGLLVLSGWRLVVGGWQIVRGGRDTEARRHGGGEMDVEGVGVPMVSARGEGLQIQRKGAKAQRGGEKHGGTEAQRHGEGRHGEFASSFIPHPSSLLLNVVVLLVPVVGYFGIALMTSVNLGFRHLLPVWPFLAVLIAYGVTGYRLQVTSSMFHVSRVVSGNPKSKIHNPKLMMVTSWLLLWLGGVTLFMAPDYLAFFNGVAGGPENGWRYLVDSNIDWGQDLGQLRPWMEENGVDEVWLSYFGEARPEYYGINYQGLDSWPPRLMHPEANPFYPHEPRPGVYAISVTNLQGVLFGDHEQFAWFKDKEPIGKLGYSIFLYEVEPFGEPVDVALGGVSLVEILPEDYARLGTNDVTVRWFDASEAMVEVQGEEAFLFVNETELLPESAKKVVVRENYAQYLVERPSISFRDALTEFRFQEQRVLLMTDAQSTWQGDMWIMEQELVNLASPYPLKIFIHLEYEGEIITQWDGLGVYWPSWQNGDVLTQRHTFQFPENAPSGRYEIWMGVYHPETGERWLEYTREEDRLFLGTIEVVR